MADQQHNPFVLPGFGQSGGAAQNPLLASMEMMRQAWSGLAGSGGMGSVPLAAPMSLDDLDRRIRDLRAVEHWLKMNLSMLSSTIQGIEVQRATIATLKSFAESSGISTESGPSPLEVVLGLKPGASGQQARAAQDTGAQETASGAARDARLAGDDVPSGASDADATHPEAMPQAYVEAATAAAQGWWSAMQKQFDALAAATAASFSDSDAKAAAAAAGGASKPAAAKTAAARSPAKKAVPGTAARKRSASRKT